MSSKTLDNGLFYAIHAKQESSDKIQLRLMIKSGSLSETDAQSGYAHLLEHMAFNGTKHFPKQKIIELFEKSGLTFGHDINSYTSFDATVYTLSIPKSNAKLLADTLLYFRDILTDIEFAQAELDREKGVVENEYHLRMPQEKSYDYALFSDYIENSEYAQHLPIGTLESIKNSTESSVNAFYKAWYRPNNARLLITGDVDSEQTVQLITEIFSPIDKSSNNNRQPTPVAPQLNTESQAYSSKVINFSQTNLFFEIPMLKVNSSEDLSHAIKLDLLDQLFNYRLHAVNSQRVLPFNEIGLTFYRLLDNKAFENIYVSHQQNESQQATEFIAQELARINQHGFSQAEYKQQLEQIKSTQAELSNIYINKNSAQLADDVINAWSKGHIEYTLDIDQQAYQTLLTTITLQELNQLAKQLINSPTKLTFATPYQASKPDLVMADKTFADTIKKPINNTQIKIEKLILPIVKKSATDSKIDSEKFYPEKQITQWQLSNGVDVVLQPDHSVNNSISMSFTAPGGENLFSYEQQAAYEFLINSYLGSGLAGLSSEALEQKFINANADFIPIIEDNNHGFTMYSVNKPNSLELLFSMLYSAFTDAKIKDSIFVLEKKRFIEWWKNRLEQPTTSSVITIWSKLHPDRKMLSIEELQAVQQSDVEALYQRLFSSANGYKLTIVGDFTLDDIKPFILQYIATLPSGKRHSFNNKPESLIKQAAKLEDNTNPQDNAALSFITVTDSPNQGIKEVYQADLMQRIISQTLTQIVREKLSLTYSPNVTVADQQAGKTYTEVYIGIVTKKEDAEKTQLVVNNIVTALLKKGISQEQLVDHKKALQQSLISKLKASPARQWFLHRDHQLGFDLGSTDTAATILDGISIEDMNRFIRVYLDPQKTLQVIIRPEKS